SVACFLPNFNRSALGVIKAELEGRGDSGVDVGTGAEVVRKPVVLDRNISVEPEVFDLIESLPSVPAPDTLVSPLRRARLLAKLLTDDASGTALLAGAGAALTNAINSRLDGLRAEHKELVDHNIEDLWTTNIHRSRVDAAGNELTPTSRQIETHLSDLDRDVHRIIRSLKEGAGLDYYKACVRREPDIDRLDIRVEIAALIRVPAVVTSVESRATDWVREQLDRFAVDIKNTTGKTRDDYRRVQEQSLAPEAVTIAMRDNVSVATLDGDGNPLPRLPGHVYSDESGQFPVTLNSWETDVITTEVDRPSFVAWYRNPSRATPAALRIAYEDDGGRWTSVQPDFIVISRRDDGQLGASIIDPHGDHFADALNKLVALADFAEAHGERFVRIESIAHTTSGLRSLDLQDPGVRETVRAFDGAEVGSLYTGPGSGPFT
ncbi:MAG: hypothetical protein WKF60_07145, partial [Ilumatobacter sp.]